MAYVPDEAVYDCNQISNNAFKIFCLLCARRNHKSETAIATANTIIRLLGLKRATTFRAIAELEESKWIERNAFAFKLLKGDFSPMQNRFNGSLKNETSSLKFETDQSQPRDSHHNNQLNTPRVLPFVDTDAAKKFQKAEAECNECNGSGLLWQGKIASNCNCQPQLFDAQQLQFLSSCKSFTEAQAPTRKLERSAK